VYFAWRGTLFTRRWMLWIFVFAILSAMIANHAGWTAAEVGRQPWVVHPPIHWTPEGHLAVGEDGVYVYDESQGLRTVDGVSANVAASQVLMSIIGFGAIYTLLGVLWIFLLNHKIQVGPDEAPEKDKTDPHGFLDASRERMGHTDSMTEAKEAG
jgi:cytochrome bd ubiquinol oxidase subunit I